MVCQQFFELLLCRVLPTRCLPVMASCPTQLHIGRLNAIFRKWQLSDNDYTIQDLAEQADNTQLLDSIDTRCHHCLQ